MIQFVSLFHINKNGNERRNIYPERNIYPMNVQTNRVLFTKETSSWFKGLAIIMVILSHYAEWWSWFYTLEGNSEIVRSGISRFGPYGVAIFFLFSGYGLTKSAGNQRIGISFIAKRLMGVYIPYLIVALLIELLSDGLQTAHDFIDLLYANDFWFMTVLFLFYLAFIVIWLIAKHPLIRAIAMTVFTFALNHRLMAMELQDFWYLSNLAFLIGVIAALYEPFILKIVDKAEIVLCILFGVGSLLTVRVALFTEQIWATPKDAIQACSYAVLGFTFFVFFFAAKWKWYDKVLRFLGNQSLYLYLTHTFLFMWAVNYFSYNMPIRFLIAAGITLIASIVLNVIISGVMRLPKCYIHK